MSLKDIRQAKIDKLKLLKKAGVDPYPAKSWRTHQASEALANFSAWSEEKKRLVLAGRVMNFREHGGVTFLDLADVSGQIQVLFKKDEVGEYEYDLFSKTVERGDFLECSGYLFETKQKEKTLAVEKYRLLAKALLPLPEKWHGLQDIEERFRKRYLDFIFNPEVKEKLALRTKIIDELRQFMKENDFIEVETPILQTLPGGALARPFKTKLNTLDLDVFLRIAPELFLKRLLVGGFERVFEIGKNFRNEGIDRDHSPEFSEMEFYIAYRDYEWLMEFTEKMLAAVVKNVFGGTTTEYEDQTINWQGPYTRTTFNNLLEKHAGLNYDEIDEATLSKKAKELEIVIEKTMTKGNIADEIYKKAARPKIIQPTFVINHPLDLSPLAKKLSSPLAGESDHVARVQLLVAGNEIVNAYSELNDPLDQRERFEWQKKAAKKGNIETHPFDEDFVEALEYGMPPAAGWGLGIDRLAAILTNSHSIREVIFFPLMKPK